MAESEEGTESQYAEKDTSQMEFKRVREGGGKRVQGYKGTAISERTKTPPHNWVGKGFMLFNGALNLKDELGDLRDPAARNMRRTEKKRVPVFNLRTLFHKKEGNERASTTTCGGRRGREVTRGRGRRAERGVSRIL